MIPAIPLSPERLCPCPSCTCNCAEGIPSELAATTSHDPEPIQLLLASNVLPCDAEINQLQALLTDAIAQDKTLDGHIDRLEKSLALARSLKSAKLQVIHQYQAALSPARRVPVELWRKIFRFCVNLDIMDQPYELTLPDSNSLDYRAAPRVLSRVCRHWRDIAISYQFLWCAIFLISTRSDHAYMSNHVDEAPLISRKNLIADYINRSGDLAISLRIVAGNARPPWVSELIRTLIPIFPRVRHLFLDIGRPEHEILSEGTFPALTQCWLGSSKKLALDSISPELPPLPYLSTSQNLKFFQGPPELITRMSTTQPFPCLDDFESIECRSFEALQALLSRVSSIRRVTLRIKKSSHNMPDQAIFEGRFGSIHLAEDSQVDAGVITYYLEHLTLPTLYYLRLNGHIDPKPIGEFLSRSASKGLLRLYFTSKTLDAEGCIHILRYTPHIISINLGCPKVYTLGFFSALSDDVLGLVPELTFLTFRNSPRESGETVSLDVLRNARPKLKIEIS